MSSEDESWWRAAIGEEGNRRVRTTSHVELGQVMRKMVVGGSPMCVQGGWTITYVSNQFLGRIMIAGPLYAIGQCIIIFCEVCR